MPARITRETLQERLMSADPPALVEASGAGFYDDAHLPGALNIPAGQVDRLAPLLLPDPTAPVVVYCSGACSSSDAVARRLEELGYGAVSVYAGGKQDWVEHGLPVERVERRE